MVFLQGVPASTLRFLFEGQRIADNQTPKEVNAALLTRAAFGVVLLHVLKTRDAPYWIFILLIFQYFKTGRKIGRCNFFSSVLTEEIP